MERLEDFLQPFQTCFAGSHAEQRNLHHLVTGLLSDLERKNAEEVAKYVDTSPLILQSFVGTGDWQHEPLTDNPVHKSNANLVLCSA